MFKKIEDDCEICFRKQRGPSRPVVGFNLAKEFNEVVALDLKQWSHSPTIWFCHMIDLATRYSVCVIIRNKQKETIINAIMKGWISIFGCPQQVHSDNGCEFNNEDFRSMAECFNIRVSTTAAESPWSNGCNERYNGIISEMVEKVLADTKCSLEVALAWAVSAKNSLQNHYGFSPNQLVFGRNPNYPSILYDELPALENKTSYEIVRTNANARHSARSAFIQKESCEKLRRAMLHKVRPTGETFNNGDHVFYRRSNDKQWQGPATVIGQENKQILVKHGGVYYRCHECNLIKRNGKIFGNNDERNNKSVSKVHPQGHEQESPIRRVYIDDEEDNCDRQLSNDHNENASVNDFNGSLVPSNDITGADTGARIEPNETDIGTEDSIQHKDNSDVTSQQPFLPAPKMRIAYVQNNNNIPCWKNATVLGRAGKVTGKNKYCLNILDDGDESGKCVDWRNVDDWKEINETINFCSDEDDWKESSEITYFCTDEEILAAKLNELAKGKINDVYKPILPNGQKPINCRWVFKEKLKPNGTPYLTARLVARGFEEDSSSMQTDSPTCGSESLKVVFSIAASKKWKGNSIDIKAAFLQGASMDRDVYLRPPPEAKSDGKIWHLKKCVYGLNDASRYWYMRVRQELFKLNMKSSKYDKAIFYWYDKGELSGIITSHVDDFFWCGTDSFRFSVIDKLRNIFEFGEEHSDFFKFIGLCIQQQENG